MKTELKTIFKRMPIEVSHSDYMILANILYASWQAMTSTNEMILIIDLVTKKVYGFDEVLEIDKIKEYAAKPKHNLLQVINPNN